MLVLLYGCEMWMLTSVRCRKIEAFHMCWQRRILGIKWSNFIRSADIWAASGQESLKSLVCLRRLWLFGHIAHMPDTVPAKAILTLACEVHESCQKVTWWKRPRGHPPTTWLRQFTNDCCLTPTEALQLATDCSRWRSHATAISATRHWWWWVSSTLGHSMTGHRSRFWGLLVVEHWHCRIETVESIQTWT